MLHFALKFPLQVPYFLIYASYKIPVFLLVHTDTPEVICALSNISIHFNGKLA